MNSYLVYVDDEDMLCDLFQIEMDALGYRVLTYSDPHKAIAELKGKSISLLISDFNMAGMSGWDLYRALETKPPFVLITGDASVLTPEMKSSCVKLCLKPFDFSQLFDAIEKYGSHSKIKIAS